MCQRKTLKFIQCSTFRFNELLLQKWLQFFKAKALNKSYTFVSAVELLTGILSAESSLSKAMTESQSLFLMFKVSTSLRNCLTCCEKQQQIQSNQHL